jgi:hypothetical protein
MNRSIDLKVIAGPGYQRTRYPFADPATSKWRIGLFIFVQENLK